MSGCQMSDRIKTLFTLSVHGNSKFNIVSIFTSFVIPAGDTSCTDVIGYLVYVLCQVP